MLLNRETAFALILFLIASGPGWLSAGEKKKMAVTIDDLPGLTHGLIDSLKQAACFRRIVQIFNNHGIQVTGFVVGALINGHNTNLLKEFIDQGHTIGNHTYSHPDLNKVSADRFITDIAENQQLLSGYQSTILYFRFPLLHRGNTTAKRDSVVNYLREQGYLIAPVTIDSDETSYNLAFVRAWFSNQSSLADSIGAAYVRHMIAKSKEYDRLGIAKTGRPVRQILLIHLNWINSFYLEPLINWYEANNWEFITLDEALKDPVYNAEDIYTGTKGVSWLERIRK